MKPVYLSITALAIEPGDEQHILVQLRNLKYTQSKPARDFHVVRLIAQYFAVGVGIAAWTLDDKVALRASIWQRRIRIPATIIGLGQQVLGRYPLDARSSSGKHAVDHHRFMKFC